MLEGSRAVAGSRFPHAPLLPRPEHIPLQSQVFDTRERTRLRITHARTSIYPRTQSTLISGADSSHIHIYLICACRKCCRPTCSNIPSSLACQQVRQHDSVPELPPHHPSQAHALQGRDCQRTSLPPIPALPLFKPLWTTPSPEHAPLQPDPHSPPWTPRTTNSTRSPCSLTS